MVLFRKLTMEDADTTFAYISTLAAKALIEYLRDYLKIEYLVSYCDARNIPSKRVMEKLGMTFVGGKGIRKYDKNVLPGEELKYEMYL